MTTKSIIKAVMMICIVFSQMSLANRRKMEPAEASKQVRVELEKLGIKFENGALSITAEGNTRLVNELRNLDILSGKGDLIDSAKSNKKLESSLAHVLLLTKYAESISESKPEMSASLKEIARAEVIIIETLKKHLKDETSDRKDALIKIVSLMDKMTEWSAAEIKSWKEALIEITSPGGGTPESKIEAVLAAKGLTLKDVIDCLKGA